MKKVSVLLVSSLLILGSMVSAQNSTPFKVSAGKFNEELNTAENSGINTKVMNNFNRMFTDASNVMWTKDKHQIDRVYFERKGKVTRAAFNHKGQFLYSITTYSEEMLPQDVLIMVKQAYYGRSIFGVTEVSALNKIAYIVILEDKTSWLHIKVLDGEIYEEKLLLKAN
jgi:hypothetical protein